MTNETKSIQTVPPEPERHLFPPSPIHPLAALATIVLDNVSGAIELVDPLALLLTSLTVGALGTVATMLVQRYLAKDEWGPAIAKGLVMGIIAGVPYQVTGTAVGALLLGWAGANKWIKLPGSKQQAQLPDEEEVVEAEVKNIESGEQEKGGE